MIRVLSTTMVMVCAAMLVPGAVHAVDWDEVGDAGPVLADAQEPDVPPGESLTSISGFISNVVTDVPINDLSGFGASVADVDLYKIMITDPLQFSALTVNGDSIDSDIEFDATLALFDENGLGLYQNDDRAIDDGNARLPAGHMFGPMSPGIYYLAIFDDNVTPISALSESGVIFPDPPFPYTEVVAATGPGGGSPLLDWFPDAPIIAGRQYSILLTGVPEPGQMAQAAAALATLVGVMSFRRRGTPTRAAASLK